MKELINADKVQYIFEYINNYQVYDAKSRSTFDNISPNLDYLIKTLSNFVNEIIVVSPNNEEQNKKIYKLGLDNNIKILLINTHSLSRKKEFEEHIYKNKIVLINRSFTGMTNIDNKIYTYIERIANVSKKTILTQCITDGYLYQAYIYTIFYILTLNNMNLPSELSLLKMSKIEITKTFNDYFYIVNNNEIINVTKDIWA